MGETLPNISLNGFVKMVSGFPEQARKLKLFLFSANQTWP